MRSVHGQSVFFSYGAADPDGNVVGGGTRAREKHFFLFSFFFFRFKEKFPYRYQL